MLQKLKISVNESPMQGYINLDPYPAVENSKQGLFELIDLPILLGLDVLSNASFNNIIVSHAIDYVAIAEVETVIQTVFDKLRHGGRVTFTGVDPTLLAVDLINGRLSLQDFNLLMHGVGDHPWTTYSSHIDVHSLRVLLEEMGAKIHTIDIDKYEYKIVGERP